ncbi:hypothetical protein OKW37_005263 [Paraburkholderia sp. MM5482-R2]
MLAHIVANKLRLQWSPQQIAGWLKRAWPGSEDYHVSHETIYRSLFIQARGALKKELLEHLRRTRAMRRSRHHTQKTDDHGRIRDAVSIRERPATVEDRAVPGHWEGDLLCGSGGSQIATLVERQTRYVMLVKIAAGADGLAALAIDVEGDGTSDDIERADMDRLIRGRRRLVHEITTTPEFQRVVSDRIVDHLRIGLNHKTDAVVAHARQFHSNDLVQNDVQSVQKLGALRPRGLVGYEVNDRADQPGIFRERYAVSRDAGSRFCAG